MITSSVEEIRGMGMRFTSRLLNSDEDVLTLHSVKKIKSLLESKYD